MVAAAVGASAQVECVTIGPTGTQTLMATGIGDSSRLPIKLGGTTSGSISFQREFAGKGRLTVIGGSGWGPVRDRASASESTSLSVAGGSAVACSYVTYSSDAGPFCGFGPGFMPIANGGSPGFLELEVISIDNLSVWYRLLSFGYDLDGTAHAGDCSVALPVELVSFVGVSHRGTPVLRWETASELDNAGFEVQRANGDGAFEKVSFVTGHGTSGAAHSYSFRDDAAVPNVAYRYRLKQLDLDGTTSFSSEVEVFTEVPGLAAISEVYPNPANGSDARVDVNLAEASTASIEVFDVRGALVRSEALALNRGENRVRLDVNGLAPGSHFAKINLGDQVVYRPFVVGR